MYVYVCVYAPKHQSILYVTQAYIVKCNIILMRNRKITKTKQKILKENRKI